MGNVNLVNMNSCFYVDKPSERRRSLATYNHYFPHSASYIYLLLDNNENEQISGQVH